MHDMEKMKNMISATKLGEILEKRDTAKMKKVLLWTLAIVGVVAAVAAIAYAVYRYVSPNFDGELDEDFIDDLEDNYFDD